MPWTARPVRDSVVAMPGRILRTLASYGRPMPRARDLGIEIGRLHPGPANAITDVAGVRVALVAARQRGGVDRWSLPVVGETWDGVLNDIDGFHVAPEHVVSALAAATDGVVAEGAMGGGTGMVCHGFKGGIGAASRVIEEGTVGAPVQANHGRRSRLRVN